MTRKMMKVMLTGAALATLAAAPALAQGFPALAINGLTTNVLTGNALSANSVGQLGRVVAVELKQR